MERDPLDTEKWSELWGVRSRAAFATGELIVWESHLAGDQGVALDALQQDDRFTEIARFGELPANKEEENKTLAVVIFEAK